MTLDEINKIIGNNIRRLRVKSGIAGVDLAKSIGVSRQHLNNYEKGQSISAVRLVILADRFKVSIEEFFKDEK